LKLCSWPRGNGRCSQDMVARLSFVDFWLDDALLSDLRGPELGSMLGLINSAG